MPGAETRKGSITGTLYSVPSSNRPNGTIRGHTYVVDDVRLRFVLTRALRVHGTVDVDLVELVGRVASVHIDYMVGVVDAKSAKKQT